MSRNEENQGFCCENCGSPVQPLTNGSYRNHCPVCLYSKHVDERPGDRASSCGGLMKPVEVRIHPAKGWQIIHSCTVCGAIRPNRVACDTIQNDDLLLFMEQQSRRVM